MNNQIVIEPLTQEAFSPFGDVIDASGEPSFMINNGLAGRYHDRARLDFEQAGRAGISVIEGQPYSLPCTLPLVERHPFGSQAFIPMSDSPFLVIVTGDDDGIPTTPRAFLTKHRQGINIRRNVWHGILTPLKDTTHFAVIDWIGEGVNLEEYVFDKPWLVEDYV